jgi:hypothetical protein
VSFYFDDEHNLFNVRVEIWQSILMGTTVLWINAESSLLTRVVDCNRVLGRALYLNSKRNRSSSQDSRVSVTNRSACRALHVTLDIIYSWANTLIITLPALTTLNHFIFD